MPITPEELASGQDAYRRVKGYEAGAKKRYWGYFSGAFWTFQSCLIGFIRNYNSSSRVWLVLPALWLVLLSIIIYKAVSKSISNGKDLDLLASLKQQYGPDISFESKDEHS